MQSQYSLPVTYLK